MFSEFLSLYVTIYIILFVVALYLLHKLDTDIATGLENTFFRGLIICYLIYVPISILATLQEVYVIHMPYAVFHAVTFLRLFLVVVCCGNIYMFSVVRLNIKYTEKKYFRITAFVPEIVAFILLLISISNGCIYSIIGTSYVKYGPLFPLFLLCGVVYFVLILVVSIEGYFRNRTFVMRSKMITTIIADCYIMVSALLATRFTKGALFPATFISAIIFFFVNMQESGIFTDVLTKMNNRRKAIEYIEDQIKEIGENHPMFLYMGDINSFKAINDQYGHLEGDQALMIVADVLKETAAKHDAFVARYGGDEFIMCWIPEEYSEASAGEARGIITEIGKGLEQRCIKNRKPYTLSMGIGYVRCVDPNTSLAEYLKTADKDLYKNKAAMKAAMAAA